jgi:hypothetical protein
VVIIGRRAGVAVLCTVVSCVLAVDLRRSLESAPSFASLQAVAPSTTAWMERWMYGSLLGGLPVVGIGLVNFLEIHGLLSPSRPRRRSLPPYPFSPGRLEVVIGEIHAQDGSRSDNPGWLTLPELGLYTGILVVGAPGRGKTAGCLYPFLQQLLAVYAHEPERRLAGLVIDPKGNAIRDIHAMAAAVGRVGDLVPMTVHSARYNVIHRPELSASALAAVIGSLSANLSVGRPGEVFWEMTSRELAMQVIRLLRLQATAGLRKDPPTMVDLYRLASAPEAFARSVEELLRVERRLWPSPDQAELEALRYWVQNSLLPADERTRSNIAAQLSMLTSMFDDPALRHAFCPSLEEESFPGFDRLLEEGKVVVLSLPEEEVGKTVSSVVGTLVKLNFQGAVLRRLARADGANATVGRACFFLADEFDTVASAPADASFFSRCREARCVNAVAIQSYASLGAKMRREEVDRVLANLATKVWLGLEDAPTARAAAELCGREERIRSSRTVTEGSQHTSFSMLDGQQIREGQGSSSESVVWAWREEYVVPPIAFTQQRTYEAIAKAFDGATALPPWKVFLRRMWEDPNRSVFDRAASSARDREGLTAAVASTIRPDRGQKPTTVRTILC